MGVQPTARALAGGKRFESLLGPDRIADIKRMMSYDKKTVREVVHIIQNEWKLLTQYQSSSLVTMIYRYLHHDVKQEVTERIREANKGKIEVVSNVVQDTIELIAIQKVRLNRILAMENKSQLVIKQASDEIRLLSDLLTRQGNLELEVGILKRAPKTISGVLAGEDGRTTAFTWIENDDELLSALQSKVITVENEPDVEDPAEPSDL